MLNNKFTFIYVLKDPRTNEVRYVGKSNDPSYRLTSGHMCDESKCPRVSWIKSLKKLGLKPIEETIDKVLIEEWEEKEKYYIQFYKDQGARLTNWAEGGFGGGGMKGKTHSEETRKKMSESHKGKQMGQAQKDKMSKAKLGNRNSAGRRSKAEGRKHHGFIDKQVAQMDINTGKVLKVWDSAFAAAKHLELQWSSQIHAACRDKRNSVGFKWRYVDE